MICSFGMQAAIALSACTFTGSFKEVCHHHMQRTPIKSASSKAFAATTEARIGKHIGVSG